MQETLDLTNEKNMKKAINNGPDILNEYDFSEGRRGRYAARYAKGTNVVVLDPDVARVFPDSDRVNEALRSIIQGSTKKAKKSRGGAAAARGDNFARRKR